MSKGARTGRPHRRKQPERQAEGHETDPPTESPASPTGCDLGECRNEEAHNCGEVEQEGQLGIHAQYVPASAPGKRQSQDRRYGTTVEMASPGVAARRRSVVTSGAPR